MENKIRVILGTVLFLSILIAGCGNTGTQTPVQSTLSTTTTTTFNGVNSVSKKFANGLSLSISVNPQLIKPGYPIHIVITESNTLSKMNNLHASDKWPINGLSVGICGTESYPFGVAVFQGSYTATNISSATPLELDNPNVIPQGCIAPVSNVTAYDFKPSSDIATLDGDVLFGSTATMQMSAEVIGGIYWAGSFPNTIEQNFEPGVYTVVGGDEWGNLVVLHFTVTN
jgi:hypothetical protein